MANAPTNLSNQHLSHSKQRFVLLAENFLNTKVGMTSEDLENYQIKISFIKNTKWLSLEYFDPQIYPKWDQMEESHGEYPGYFQVIIDPLTNTVIDSYISSN